MYGISFSLLGLLVLINFVTQLGIDLVFSFFSHKFNIPKTVKSMPIITVVGLFVYAILPWLMPGNEYFAIALGTVIFSAAAGLGEVLISPTFAAIPSDDPEREMSKLHSAYAWGVVGVTIVCTLFLFVFGKENWQILAMLLSVIPLTSAYLYAGAEVPKMETPEKISGGGAADWQRRKRGRFGGVFDRYHIGNADGRSVVQEVRPARGRLRCR